MQFFGKRTLFLGAHPDDIELGCGALIHHIQSVSELKCVTLSDNQKNPQLKNVVTEHLKSMSILGVPKENVILGEFTTRIFHDSRQEILEYFLKLRRDFNPDIIFVHSKQDIHQDHNTIYNEGVRAFKHFNMLGYEMPWNNFGFKSYVFVNLTREQIVKKMQALEIYKSQANRPYSSSEFVESLAKVRAIQIGREYAESFELIRFIQL